MKLESIILAFLAVRCPAAYTAEAIRDNINYSGRLDAPASADEISTALGILLRKGFVKSEVELVGTRIYWNATPEGVQAWDASGRPYVGR